MEKTRVENFEDREGNSNDRVKNKIARFFDKYGAHGAISEILKITEPFLKSGMVRDSDKMVSWLEDCRLLVDKEAFVDRVFSAQEALLEFRNSNPEEFQRIWRQSVEYFPLNEVLSYNRALYEKGSEHIFIHLDPVEQGEVSMSQIKKGLGMLVEVLEKDESIKVINAYSWIVAKNPGIFEKLGFELGETLNDEEMEKYFPGEKRPVRRSSITREDFFKKYLKS